MKVSVAYIGWLNPSVTVQCLERRYAAEATALCPGIGQRESLAIVRRQGLGRGATGVRLKRRVVDLALASLASAGCVKCRTSFSSASSARAR